MKRFLVFLLPLLICALVAPSEARAQAPATCVQPGTITRADLGGRDLATVQLGLRTVLAMQDEGLDDGSLGPVTRGALRDLCRRYSFINADPANDVAETLDLALAYGELARVVPDWPSRLATLENLIIPGAARLDLRVLRIAGPSALTAGVLSDDTQPLCESIDVGGIAAPARPALDALLQTRDVTTLCADLQVPNPASADVVAVLTALSGLQGDVDAIAILQSTDFATWLAQDLQNRLIQLAGTNAGVLDLIVQFEAQRPREQVFIAPTPASCEAVPDATTLRFYSFGQQELDLLANTVDIGQLLEPLAEAEGARSAEALWDQMQPLLEGGLDQCALDRIEGLVLGPDRLGLGYQLDAERVADFKLSPDLIDSEPILAPLIGIRVPNDADLLAGLRVNLTRALTESLNGQIEVAAELLAGAAEEVQESLDVARVDPESFDEVELPPLLGITDPSVTAALNTITNEAFKRAIFEGPFIVGANDEILRAEVRRLLRPLIADQVAQAVNRDVALIASAIRSDWRVTPRMLERINTLPEVARVAGDPTGARLPERMAKLVGLQYPNESLFRAALRDVDPVSPNSVGPSLSPALEDRAVEVAQKSVEDPDSTRVTGPLAVPDCGCVVPKVFPASNDVYGFYPFWFAPLEARTSAGDESGDAAQQSSGGEATQGTDDATGGDAAPGPVLIDYSFISRVAFYGMEFDFEFPDEGADRRNLQLNYLNHWLNMRRDFINSAHQHRAKVDVAFDLRNWREWTEIEQTYVVDRIVQYSGAIPRFESRSLEAIRAAIPTLFDRMKPDGVTLIFEDYSGDPASDIDVSIMVRLVERVRDALAARGQTVNLAFDLTFVGVDGQAGLMDDLRELLIPGNDGEKTVDKVMVFLERPTTLTKKLLRQRLDFGDFRGTERETVADNILPVLPAGGHENVTQRVRANDESQTKAAPYSQFTDDLVYFAKDFSGVAFWPVPDQSAPETAELQRITLSLWQAPLLPKQLATFESGYREFCTWACPQRAAIGLVTLGVFTLLVGLVAFSYYSGVVDKIAFKWYAAHLSVVFVLLALLVLTTCDPAGAAPPWLLLAFLATLLLLSFADFIQRMRNGPKP